MIEAPFLICAYSTFCYVAALANEHRAAVPFGENPIWQRTLLAMPPHWRWYHVGNDHITGAIRYEHNWTAAQLFDRLSLSTPEQQVARVA